MFAKLMKSSCRSVGHNTYDKSQSSKACDWHEKSSGLGCPTTNDCAVDGILPHSELDTAYPVSLMLGAVTDSHCSLDTKVLTRYDGICPANWCRSMDGV